MTVVFKSNMWWCLPGDYKLNLIPTLIGPFMEVTLVPQMDLRNVLIPIFHDMMDCEQRRSGNFKQVLKSQRHKHVSACESSVMFMSQYIMCGRHSKTLWMPGNLACLLRLWRFWMEYNLKRIVSKSLSYSCRFKVELYLVYHLFSKSFSKGTMWFTVFQLLFQLSCRKPFRIMIKIANAWFMIHDLVQETLTNIISGLKKHALRRKNYIFDLFLKVEAKLIDKLEGLMSEGKGDETYRELFNNMWVLILSFYLKKLIILFSTDTLNWQQRHL